jgi:hypothetical protein
MAFGAGNVLVTAVELKPGTVVIELNRLPPFIQMTAGTGSLFTRIKLIIMNIGVAIQTTAGQVGKALFDRSAGIRLKMAFPATGFSMFARQLKVGCVVIKFNLAPGCRIMATLTILVPEILDIHIILMNVFVAIRTSLLQIFENPVFLFPVTGNTRSCQMRPFQDEIAFIVIFNGI